VVASLIGDVPWYLAGRLYGYRVLRTLCRISIEPDTCVKQTENIFGRWGPASLVVAKYIPGFATIAPPLAGTMRLPFGRFLLYSALAALLWAAVPALVGFLLHRQLQALIVWLEQLGTGALIVLGAALALYVAVKSVERYLLIRFLRMVRISADELDRLMHGDTPPVIVDVRLPLAREAEPRQIPGAVVSGLEAVELAIGEVPADRDVVVYCS
jgi:hypothetical protein